MWPGQGQLSVASQAGGGRGQGRASLVLATQAGGGHGQGRVSLGSRYVKNVSVCCTGSFVLTNDVTMIPVY